MKSYRVIAVVNDQAKMKMGSSDMLRWNRGMAGRKHSIEVTKKPIDFFFLPNLKNNQQWVGKLIGSVESVTGELIL